MNNRMNTLSLACCIGVLLCGATQAALAQNGAKKTPPAAAKSAGAIKCPSCGMPMPAAKSAAAPQAIKVNGKTVYCCTACDSGKKAVAYMKAHKGAVLSVTTAGAAAKPSKPGAPAAKTPTKA